MKICIVIGEKNIIRKETRSWTTSHFTWGEGSQVRDHFLTTTHFFTNIEVYVDEPELYLQYGLTSDEVIDHFDSIPNLKYIGIISLLTGLNLVYYQDDRSIFTRNSLIPGVEKGILLFLGEEEHSICHSYSYKKIELVESPEKMVLMRKLKWHSKETEESFI